MPVKNRIRCSVIFIVAQFLATVGWAEVYRIGINDTLNIQITVWDAGKTEVVDTYEFSGSYPVGADGDIAVTLAGSLVVEGMTTAEVAKALQEAMKPFTGIGQTPHAAVSVERYAPIYVDGDVQQPGVYEYAPGLTVQKAVTLASGLSGVKALDGEERNYLNARGTISVLQRELTFLTAKRDRLMAEINGDADFGTPDSDLDPVALAAESMILQARNTRYDHEVTSLARSRTALEDALGVLEDKLATNREQLEAGQAELQREEQLAERGLVASTRVFERASYVNELESRLLDIERSILSARQEMQGYERNEGLLMAVRNEENATTLQQVNTSIAGIEAKLDGQYDLLAAAAGRQIGQVPALDPSTATTSYTITRVRGDDLAPFVGDPSVVLMPGDVVEVDLDSSAEASPSN